MFDFTPFHLRETAIAQLTADLTKDDLRRLTNDMVDAILDLIANCTDAAVTFVPNDPDAFDSYAEDETEVELAWTLGHIIVHVTASSEEGAFLAAEMARGVPAERRRSRYEIPWREITTIDQCRRRLEESRQMLLASLALWPEPPHLDNVYTPWSSVGEMNAVGRFMLGLAHSDSHLAQIADVVQQAHTFRS